jgi:hypothetical protein
VSDCGSDHVQQRGPCARLRARERGHELVGAPHRLGVRAVGARERGEIGIDEIGARHAAGIVALLVHADRA